MFLDETRAVERTVHRPDLGPILVSYRVESCKEQKRVWLQKMKEFSDPKVPRLPPKAAF